ncbi:MAG TPA: hypothetical protein VFE44_08235, partial [Thermoanaerobaculia bacterium]|nr:hypothetical protein [Thermoanaerobaculia bacterium]
MVRRPCLALPLVLAALLAPSPKSVAGAGRRPERPPEANLAAVFPDWPAWQRAAAELGEAIDRFAALRSSPWAGPEDLLAALRAKDEVHRLAARVDGYLGLRLALDRADAEALSRRPTMDRLTAAWDGDASAWFEPRLRTLGAERIESWLAADSRLRPYRWMLRRAARPAPRELAVAEKALAGEIDAERENARRVHS